MNISTLRFGMVRTAALTVVIAAAALYAQGARAEAFVPARPSPALTAALQAEVQAELAAELSVALARESAEHRARLEAELRAARIDLIAKAAASALDAPRGFGLAIPAVLVQPTL